METSHQYDLKLQTLGLSSGSDSRVVRGDPNNRSFCVICLNRGRAIALDCVNSIKDYAQGRTLVLTGFSISEASLADTSVTLK